MNLEYTTTNNIKVPDHLPNWQNYKAGIHPGHFKVAILGVEEFRGNHDNKGCEKAPDKIRKHLFQLRNFPSIKILDVGDIIMGETNRDSHFALKATVNELLRNNLIPVILGGDQTLLHAQQLGYHDLQYQFTNILHVDEKFSIGHQREEDYLIDEHNYVDRLVSEDPNIIFNYTQIGYQSYFVDQISIDIIKRMGFECYRLGEIRSDLKEVEPIVRDSDLIAINVSAMRQSDAPGYFQPSPNGFSAEEICTIARYAGLSDRLSSFAFYGYNPDHDQHDLTGQAIAQAIWYFIQGVHQRKDDYPAMKEEDFSKFIVTSKEIGYDITFLKSKKSDRWWISIPEEHAKYDNIRLFPCSYKDYEMALNEEIPERWWKAYNKLV